MRRLKSGRVASPLTAALCVVTLATLVPGSGHSPELRKDRKSVV